MATEQINESGKKEVKTETITVVVNSFSAEKMELLSQRKEAIQIEMEAITATLFEVEGHQVLPNTQLTFSEGFKKVSFVKNVEQNPK